MPTECENCKANPVDIAETTQGTPTVKLVAILIAQGITDTKRLAEITGLKIRAVQAARNALQCAQQNAPAQHSAPKTQQNAPSAAECAQHTAPLARAYKESLRDTSNQDNKQTDSRELAVSQSAFNQTSENLIADAARWMNVDRIHAVKWVTTMIGIAGPDAVLAAYAQLLESQSKGKLIADPIRYIGKTAPTLKGQPKPKTQLEIDGKPFRVTGVRYARPADEVMGNA